MLDTFGCLQVCWAAWSASRLFSAMSSPCRSLVSRKIAGRASDLLRSRVLIEMYNARLIGTWRRLKVCHNARCHEVFFDQSKNNSRTWFDTAACADALNLRAYRERRKAARFSDLSERDPG
jgi:CGNR zinc finger